ncbi:MAG TPA: response regulator [Bacteroidales bacterium]|jgi:two-component system cell cycle response regulator DivK|nr:response regulator [Bacteroidales bacterium]
MEHPNLEQKNILVVEDEERNWLLIRDIIELCNGNAIWAESGMQAVDKVKAGNISLVLMDLQLPFMSGIETTRKIREINKEVPVIAQTAFSDPELLHKCTKAGCNKYILKPLDVNEMYNVLSDYLC